MDAPNFSKSIQSSSNLELIKCLSKIDSKNGLVNNKHFMLVLW